MDFEPDLGLEAFRQEVRAFLRESLPADLAGRPRSGTRSARADLTRWQGILNQRGWGAPSWPKEHGGTGWSVLQRLIFDEECVAAGAPSSDTAAQRLLGPVLNAFGTPAQRAEHIPHMLSGERQWCQGFSEPGSGSDLASLRTRAVLDVEGEGDHYVVNGQKIWTTCAHRADWIFLLVRTDPEAKKQAGITFLLVDMKSPGITVRPIRSIDGCHHLNETFFEDVRVPVANRVGEEGAGWSITKFLLNNEHATAADLPMLRRYLAQVRSLAARKDVSGRTLAQRHEFALRLARYEAELNAIAMLVQRVASMEEDHSPAAHAMGSMLKIRGTELQQAMSTFLVEALGDYGAVAYPTLDDEDGHGDARAALPMQDLGRGIASEMFFRRASTIYGGTSEVQRTIIAKSLFNF
ncbi:acyl-CoA dehydrogenase [Cupriavidus oxalaticus]|jgi:acyl-CoA dehydrogenase|uniref:Acyl-CoA dehydrogenase n=1 Tax=Cupriavidus oxalaticus TaxID=96344 RepID=A0A375FLL8_9BURK|nr:acyl-CoA dehydrogenase [Cupriavidus oxalaticus]QRQ83487.1 acyl-CoA dehydrogenase [Cupriavidus oxalaticus]QRQ92424.1 acyl-CoA dehydrogenase [Cupriavidus oxalaticus]WQD87042.1 acyl-CoA dehydrogenase [Cupriavidus oxalaticus]SPC07618.1 Acyl-CoA dehydrogenase [Cupriavidus oxalaticus]SPC24590.1 Acyl-CoA dehydrogenase [Cupriavidus oxalaticus]